MPTDASHMLLNKIVKDAQRLAVQPLDRLSRTRFPFYNDSSKSANAQQQIYGKLTYTEIPRRINSTNIFTSKGDDFDNFVLSLSSFPPVCLIFSDPLSQIRASAMIFSGRFK
jgi:hypothetical protein